MKEINTRILIADDDRVQRHFFRGILYSGMFSGMGSSYQNDMAFHLRLFNDGAPLVEYFQEEFEYGRRIPLCILDMRMITMSGIQTAEAVRAVDPEVIIVIITSYEDITHEQLMKTLKKDVYFMNKPIRSRELRALVTSLLINWNNQQSLHAAYQGIKEAEEKVRESESYLKAIMSAVQTSVMIIDPKEYKIIDANPYTLKMLQCEKEDLIGKDFYEFRYKDESVSDSYCRVVSNEYTLRTQEDNIIHVRRSIKGTRVKGKSFLVQSLLNITDIRAFMKKQEISIELAKHLLQMINGTPPRYTCLENELSLFFDAFYLPCFKEGGDHYFLRTLNHNGQDRTLISLKDQSGHEVGCILRSIITDLAHHTLLNKFPDMALDKIITTLNHEIYSSRAFKLKDFFTSVDAAIHHETLEMTYLSAGHPRFFLIRGNEISGLPGHGGIGRNLPIPILPDMVYSAGTCHLKAGDKLIFYSDGLNDLSKIKKNDSVTYEMLESLLQEIIDRNPAIAVSDLIYTLLNVVLQKSGTDRDSIHNQIFPDDITVLGLEIENKALWHEKIFKPETSDDLHDLISDLYIQFLEHLRQREFDISDLGLRSVLTESIVNAWIHGNKRDRNKSVTVQWRYGNDFHLAIHDEGKGFDYHEISNPKSEENITRTSGRGIYIIRRFSDSVHWKKGGRCILITIKKNGGRVD